MKHTPMTRWERLLWKLNIASRRQVADDLDTIREEIEEEKRRINTLHNVLLSVPLAPKFSVQLTDDPAFHEAMSQLPIFPYGNDSSRPK